VTRARGRPHATTSALVPAGARAAALDDVEAILNVEAIEVFAKAVGGRAQLADTLAVAGTGTAADRITSMLLDPRYAAWGLPRICATAGITVADLFAAYRKALVARAHIQATHIIASRLPPIVDDVMTRAAPQASVCPTCAGAAAAGSCPTCGGTGRVMSTPDLDRQKLALELGQLLEKKGGLIVQQNNTVAALGSSAAPGALEQLQQAVGDLLFGGNRRDDEIEADIIEPESDVPPEADPLPPAPHVEPDSPTTE
jgi:hypothetical protein